MLKENLGNHLKNKVIWKAVKETIILLSQVKRVMKSKTNLMKICLLSQRMNMQCHYQLWRAENQLLANNLLWLMHQLRQEEEERVNRAQFCQKLIIDQIWVVKKLWQMLLLHQVKAAVEEEDDLLKPLLHKLNH